MTYRTEQKEKLMTFLHSAERELPMSAIVSAMKEEGVGESTVYRLMRELVDAGEVRRFPLGSDRRFSYQAVRDSRCGHHIHLKCVVCGKTIHLSGFVSDFILKQVLSANKFAVDENLTQLYGRCVSCMKK